jgi:hypothetical protein
VRRLGIVVGLCGMLVWSACSTAWIGEAEQIVGVMMPGIANVVTLVAMLQGRDTSNADLQTVQSGGAQVEGDLQLLQSLITQYERADATGQNSLLRQIQAEISAVQENLTGLMSELHIKDPATQGKITAIVEVLLAEVQSIEAIVPPVNAGESQMMRFAQQSARIRPPLSASEFVSSYDAIMGAKTGQADLDRAASVLLIHEHGKFARWASAGLLK